VAGITPYLSELGEVSGNPERLVASMDLAFIGVVVYGEGFVLSTEQAQTLITAHPTLREVISPYLNGENLNSNPTQTPERCVIDFGDRSIEEARAFPQCLEILERLVKPYRKDVGEKRMREKWWLHQRPRPALRKAVEGLDRILARSRVSNINSIAFVPTSVICSDAMVVFASDDDADFAVLQAAPHTEWLTRYASSMRTDVRYNPSDCFETYPLPTVKTGLRDCGKTYHRYRAEVMEDRQEGLTKTYNRFHDPNETSAGIQELRELHLEMDQAVAAAYGWDELDLGHGFHETKQGLRFTISESARREVLARLLKLNHERYAEEVAQGLHDKKKKKGKSATGNRKASEKKVPVGPTLFGDEDHEEES